MNNPTTTVPLTPEQIRTLRDALNLAAEYTAMEETDLPPFYTHVPPSEQAFEQTMTQAEIAKFRELDDYLRQYDEHEHRPVTHECHGGQTLYGSREDCLFCKPRGNQ